MYLKEKQMYPDVCKWLEKLLKRKFKGAILDVDDTSEKVLSKWLIEKGYHKYFEGYQTYEINVDVTGFIKKSNETNLAFVECKLGKISLRDLSQLLGYSKVAKPILSVIVSPQGISQSMNLLLNISRRNDILYYTADRHIIIGQWDEKKCELDQPSIIPKGSLL